MSSVPAKAVQDARRYVEHLINRVNPEDIRAFLVGDVNVLTRDEQVHVEAVAATVRALDIQFHVNSMR